MALPDEDSEGKTWAAGVRGGAAYLRIYEKGKQPEHRHMCRPHWARIELEARPHYARDKRAAASWQPVDAWGLASWSHRVGEAVTRLSITRHEPAIRQYSYDKTTVYLALQFRRHWERMRDEGLHFQRTIEAVWEEHDKAGKQ